MTPFENLLDKLKELFQLNQPDLDFGIYRVMHAKAEEVERFLEHDLLPQVQDALEAYASSERKALEEAVEQNQKAAADLGVDPEETKPVRELRARLRELPDPEAVEADVYEDLLRFFSRYYSAGDFLARRVYKEGVYAIPYHGEEVAFDWATRDQYYIKSSDTLRDFAFRLPFDVAGENARVRFSLVGADEEEHTPVTGSGEKKKRVFALATDSPPEIVDGELVIYFRYVRSDSKQSEANEASVEAIRSHDNLVSTPWLEALLASAPTKSDPTRTLLRKHLDNFTSRNTFDYFVHKDLGPFLRRELDFFIKNEVLRLDDIEDVSIEKADQVLAKVKAIRTVAGKVIGFLAALEDFQRKLWLKKKFVVRADYLLSPGWLTDDDLEVVLGNESQVAEWTSQLQLLDADANLTVAELREMNGLLVDTRHFPDDEGERFVSRIPDIDGATTGWLLAGDNFQSLQLLSRRFWQSVGMVYADPPYNTGSDFIYKDGYMHATWLTMMENRLRTVYGLLEDNGRFFCSIDDRENENLLQLLRQVWTNGRYLGAITWEKRTKPQNTKTAEKMLQSRCEYIHPFVKSQERQEFFRYPKGQREYPESDDVGPFRIEQMEEMSAEGGRARATMVYPILGISPRSGKQWQVGQDYTSRKLAEGDIFLQDDWPHRKIRPHEEPAESFNPFWSHFFDRETYGTAENGLSLVDKDLGFGKAFQTVKPLPLLEKLVFHSAPDGAVVLDPFAGSGTTAHAVLSTNRSYQRNLRFIMLEAGDWFDSLLLPRVKKVFFANDWEEGVPRTGELAVSVQTPALFKVVRLEQYEDSLNNLVFRQPETTNQLLAEASDDGREEYIIRYMLDVESRGSQSLLNLDGFKDPRSYSMQVQSTESDRTVETRVDLVETFNWLLGLRVEHISASESFEAEFSPEGGRARVNVMTQRADGPWWFRSITGVLPDGRKALVVWRTVSEDLERDEAVLHHWLVESGRLAEQRVDVLFVNGDCNLEATRPANATWVLETIEDRFLDLMFSGELR